MPTIRLPTVLARLADDRRLVEVNADTAGAALAELGRSYPDLGRQLIADGQVRPFVKVFLGADEISTLQGSDTPLAADAVLRVVPAIAGG